MQATIAEMNREIVMWRRGRLRCRDFRPHDHVEHEEEVAEIDRDVWPRTGEHPGVFERRRKTRMKMGSKKGNVKIRRKIRRPQVVV